MHLIFDAEWAGGSTPSKVHCLVTKNIKTGEVREFYRDDVVGVGSGGDVDCGVQFLQQAQRLVGHAIIKADLYVLQSLYGMEYTGEIVDTLLLSRLLNPDRRLPYGFKGSGKKIGPHSLEAWAVRIGKAGVEKVQHENWEVFDENMLRRCITDVHINHLVYNELLKEANA